MAKLILMRHGQTKKNILGLLHRRSDPSVLDEVGRQQVSKTAERLREFLPLLIFASPEARTSESAKILAKILGGDGIQEIDDLAERDWGELEGRPWPEVQNLLEKMDLSQRYRYQPPGGESWREFERRTVQALKKILSENKKQNVVIVTHAGVIRVLLPELLGKSREESFKYNPANASLTVLTYEEGNFSPEAIDDTGHLEE